MNWNLGNVDKNKVKEISGCDLDEIKKILKGKLDYKKIWMRDTIPPFYYYDAKKQIFEDIWLMEPSIIDSVTLRIKQLERRMDEASYRTKYALMDKRLRIPALISEYEKIPDDELYDVFSFVYRASEYGFELFTKDMIKQIKSRVPIEQATPSSYENEDKIIVYRGIGSKSNVDGYSWTTDPDIAIFFAKRFDKNGLIFVGKIKAKKILFEFESDKEVIIDPSEVEELDKIPVEDFIDQHRNTDLSMKNI